jgi:hypothetical protein
VFGGDGMNRPNIDNRVDGMGRAVFRPLWSRSDALKGFHVGASGRYGYRNQDFVRYDAPALSTPGGYTFWATAYDVGKPTETHLLQTGRQAAIAGELYLPFERWDLKGEWAYVNQGMREVAAADRFNSGKHNDTTQRHGVLKGVSAYAQLSWWIAGTPRINGHPAGYYGVTKLPKDGDRGLEAPYGIQLALRGEIVRLSYDANAERGDPGSYDKLTQNIQVNAYQGVLNYWFTKHIRLSAEYSLYQFPGSPLYSGATHASNQAVAPGVKSGTALDAHLLHELSFRVGLAL